MKCHYMNIMAVCFVTFPEEKNNNYKYNLNYVISTLTL